MPRGNYFELYATTMPSRTVGGDYYDVITLPGERYGFAVADVSGKGLGAAMMAATLQGAFAAVAAAGVERVGHTLKGALGNLSATGASAYAGELETMGRSGNLALAGAKLLEVENEVHRAMETLDALSLESV